MLALDNAIVATTITSRHNPRRMHLTPCDTTHRCAHNTGLSSKTKGARDASPVVPVQSFTIGNVTGSENSSPLKTMLARFTKETDEAKRTAHYCGHAS